MALGGEGGRGERERRGGGRRGGGEGGGGRGGRGGGREEEEEGEKEGDGVKKQVLLVQHNITQFMRCVVASPRSTNVVDINSNEHPFHC